NIDTAARTVTVSASNGAVTLKLAPGQSTNLTTASDGVSGTNVGVLCFCRGTQILTERGDIPVQDLVNRRSGADIFGCGETDRLDRLWPQPGYAAQQPRATDHRAARCARRQCTSPRPLRDTRPCDLFWRRTDPGRASRQSPLDRLGYVGASCRVLS